MSCLSFIGQINDNDFSIGLQGNPLRNVIHRRCVDKIFCYVFVFIRKVRCDIGTFGGFLCACSFSDLLLFIVYRFLNFDKRTSARSLWKNLELARMHALLNGLAQNHLMLGPPCVSFAWWPIYGSFYEAKIWFFRATVSLSIFK